MKQLVQRIPRWVRTVFPLVLILFLAFNLYYRLGSSGVRVKGTSVEFDRNFDYELYRVNETYAFKVDNPTSTLLVRYDKILIPFRWVCGTYESGLVVLRTPVYQKGDLLFSGHIGFQGDYCINTRTGQTYATPPPPTPDPNNFKLPEPFEQKELYTALGIDPAVDTNVLITPVEAVKTYPKLSVANESSIVFNAAFFLIFAVLLVAAFVGILAGGRKAPTSA